MQVGPETFEHTATIELFTPGFEEPLVIEASRRQSLPKFENSVALFGQDAREQAAERAAARRILRDVYQRLARNVYIQVEKPEIDDEGEAEEAISEEAAIGQMPAF